MPRVLSARPEPSLIRILFERAGSVASLGVRRESVADEPLDTEPSNRLTLGADGPDLPRSHSPIAHDVNIRARKATVQPGWTVDFVLNSRQQGPFPPDHPRVSPSVYR